MTNEKKMARIALLMTVGGVLAWVVIALAGNIMGRNWVMPGYLVFAAAELTAIVLGLMSKDSLGRGSAIAAGCLVVGSLATLS